MIFDKLKNNISLNLLSVLGHVGFVVLIYYLLFSRNIHDSFPFVPRITLDIFWKYLVSSAKIFILLLITATFEPFLIAILRLQKLKFALKRYFKLIPDYFFISGCVFAFSALFICWCLYIPADVCD